MWRGGGWGGARAGGGHGQGVGHGRGGGHNSKVTTIQLLRPTVNNKTDAVEKKHFIFFCNTNLSTVQPFYFNIVSMVICSGNLSNKVYHQLRSTSVTSSEILGD